MQIGIQLYTLRNLDESLPETIERVGQSAFEGVQFAGLNEVNTAEVATALEAAGLQVAGAHIGVDELDDDCAGTIATYEEVGCDEFVVPHLDSESFESKTAARETGRELADLAGQLADDGVGLHYHNHSHEFTPLDGQTGFEIFADAAEGVGLEIDTGLTNYCGADPVALLERYSESVSLVHLTDSRQGGADTQHVDLGTGDVDLQACVDVCTDAGVDWLLFEHGLTDDPVASMEAAADAMAEML